MSPFKAFQFFALIFFASTKLFSQELVVWAWDPNFNLPIITEAGNRYSTNHSSFNLDVIDFNKGDLEAKLASFLESGDVRSLPDIVLIEDYMAQSYLHKYHDLFVPLEKYVSYKGFADYKLSSMTYKDLTYGIPFDSGVAGLFVRSDVLSSIGISAQKLDALTWDEFIEIGKQLQAANSEPLITVPKGNSDLLKIMMQSRGSWFTDNEGQLDISNNAELIRSLKIMKRFYDEDLVQEVNGWSDWVATFHHHTNSIISGAWIIGSIQANADHAGKWTLLPVPHFNDMTFGASNLGGSSWYVINKGSSKNKTSVDFLNSVFTGDAGFYSRILRRYGAIGTYVPLIAGRATERGYVFFNNQPIYKSFVEWIPQIPQVNYGEHTGLIANELMAQFHRIVEGEDIYSVLVDVENRVVEMI